LRKKLGRDRNLRPSSCNFNQSHLEMHFFVNHRRILCKLSNFSRHKISRYFTLKHLFPPKRKDLIYSRSFSWVANVWTILLLSDRTSVFVSLELRQNPQVGRKCWRTQWHLSPYERYWFCSKFPEREDRRECRNSMNSLLTIARDENRRRKIELFRPMIRAKNKEGTAFAN